MCSLYNLLKTTSPAVKLLDNRLYVLTKEMKYKLVKQKLPEYVDNIEDINSYRTTNPIPNVSCFMSHIIIHKLNI